MNDGYRKKVRDRPFRKNVDQQKNGNGMALKWEKKTLNTWVWIILLIWLKKKSGDLMSFMR